MQNFLKRLYLLLMTIILAVVVFIALLAPAQMGSWLTTSLSETSSILRIVLAAIIGGGLLAITYLQVRPVRQEHSGLVMKVSGAITDVSIESARDRILKAVEAVPDVISAEATIKPVRGKADMELHVIVMGHGIKLPDKQKEINRALKQVINKQLGLQMAGRPRVHIELHTEAGQSAAPQLPKPAEEKASVKPAEVLRPAEAKTPAKPAELPKPVEAVEPEPEAKNGGGLFGGWRRNRHPEDAPESVIPPAAMTKDAPSTPPSPTPPAVDDVDDSDDDMSDSDEDGSDTLILNSEEQASARQQLADILGMPLDDENEDDDSLSPGEADEDEARPQDD